MLEDAWKNGHVVILETSVSVSDLETTSVWQSKMERQVEFYLLVESWEKEKKKSCFSFLMLKKF